MENKGNSTVTGIVTEALPNTMFRVLVDPDKSAGEAAEGRETIAYLSGKMRFNRIRILVGDKVEILEDPYGGKGRIVKRL